MNLQYINMIWCYILSILASNCVCSYGQIIKMMPYRQEDSETSCTRGLISDVDTVVFKAEVDFYGDIKMRYVYFQLKTNSDSKFHFIEGIVINGSVADKNRWEITRPNVAQFIIKDKAITEKSGARIRGVLVTSDYKEFVSDEQIYPEIKESNNLKIRLLINGVETPIQNNICENHVNGVIIVIMFECQSDALPCLIEITSYDLMSPLLGKGYVLHTSELPELNITIKYASCTLHGEFHTINCHITRDIDPDTRAIKEEINVCTVHILSTVIAILNFIIIGIFIIVLWRRKRHTFLRECPQHKNVLYDCKCKKVNSLDGKNHIQGENLESCTDCNSPSINNCNGPIGIPVDIATDEVDVSHPLMNNAGNLKNLMTTTFSKSNLDEKQGVCCKNRLPLKLNEDDFDAAKINSYNGADVNQAE